MALQAEEESAGGSQPKRERLEVGVLSEKGKTSLCSLCVVRNCVRNSRRVSGFASVLHEAK